MKYLAAHPLTARDYERIPELNRRVFDIYDWGAIPELTLLYHLGYLTIKDFDPISDFTLGVPNEDVRRSLARLVGQSQQGKAS